MPPNPTPPAAPPPLPPPPPRRPTLVFFHPDLGIGGAERLVVDAAVGLQRRGHRVVIFTNHCDPRHCFDECCDGTLDVRVRGSWLVPPSVFSRLTILCAVARHVHLLLAIALSGELARLEPAAFVVDQLSAGLPLLQYLSPRPILFYCHFPDLLLARGRESSLKRLYRIPFDWLEEWSMGFAHAVAVNSNFTKGIVEQTWPRLQRRVQTRVVYPCVDTDDVTKTPKLDASDTVFAGEKLILSINRFERKKDVALAIKAFAAIPEPRREGVRLVIAGGHDSRVVENVQYHAELEALADSLSLAHLTTKTLITALSAPRSVPLLFLLSIPNSLKAALLRDARLLVYTPSNEHFGIVPLEAMLSRTPVLAANTGGPVETILDGRTGWLRDPADVSAWSAVMQRALDMSDAELERMGEQGAQRVKTLFGREKMAETLDTIVDEIVTFRRPPPIINAVLNFAGILLFFGFGFVCSEIFARARRAKAES